MIGVPLAVALLLVFAGSAPARDSPPTQTAAELIQAVVINELADRTQGRKWMYVIEKREGKQTTTQEQVDTNDGPLYRLLSIDGRPLDPGQRQQEETRLDRLLQDPGRQLKSKQVHDEDEQKLEAVIRMMPAAFLYEFDGVDGTLVRLKFRPNADYSPATYEARVMRSLAGTILIDPKQKRLAKLSGQLINRVDFGFGIFGSIANGGTVELGRIEVGPSQWKTSRVHIQLSGRLAFFKTISKRQDETRSDFRSVPPDLSLREGNQLLSSGMSRGG